MRRKTPIGAALFAVAAALLGGPSRARAEFFEFTSTVTISPVGTTPAIGPASITTGNVNVTQGSFTQSAPYSQFNSGANNNVQMIALSSDPGDLFHENAQDLGTDIVYGQVDTRSAATSAVAETIAFNFTFSLSITDYTTASGGAVTGTGGVQLSGRVSGTMGRLQVNLKYYNFSIAPPTGQFTIPGVGTYTVSLNPNTFPGVSNNGTLGAHLALQSFTRQVPEPASLALLGLGGLGALSVFRRRRKAA